VDPLAQILALLRPEGLLWKQMEGHGDWGVAFPASAAVVFVAVQAGQAVAQCEGGRLQRLGQGDVLVLNAPAAWSLLASERSVAVARRDIVREAGPGPVRLGAGPAPAVRIVGGQFRFADDHADLLRHLLPAVIAVGASAGGATRLGPVLALLADEAAAERPGRGLVIERLLSLLLIEALRHAGEAAQPSTAGLLAGLADPRLARVLQAVHADIAQPWTVARLAAIAGLSRSVFAARFSRALDLPPMDYVLRWRMALARDALRKRDVRLKEVAAMTGYASVSAFSAAFHRAVGCPPSAFARAPDVPG
jgi:AraC-like DNA-binding protein